MKEYLRVVKQIIGKFYMANVTQVTREKNRHADSLATLASEMMEDIPRLIKVELITKLSIGTTVDGATRVGMTIITTTRSCWMDPIIKFLAEDRVSDRKSVV